MSLEKKINNLYNDIENGLKVSERLIEKEYIRTLRDVRAEMASIYEKYAKEGKLTLQEMNKFNRLTNLFDRVDDEYKELTGVTKKETISSMRNSVTQGYDKTYWAYETESGLGLRFTKLNTKAINKIVNKPFSGLDVRTILAKNKAEGLIKIKQTITQSLVRGEGIQKMARNVKEFFGNDLFKAKRVIQTETLRVLEEARFQAYNEAIDKGLKIFREWLTAMDAKVREDHVTMNKQVDGKDEQFTIKTGNHSGTNIDGPRMSGFADFDINCRCRTVEVLQEDYEPKPESFDSWIKRK
jgi:hypothetical protein